MSFDQYVLPACLEFSKVSHTIKQAVSYLRLKSLASDNTEAMPFTLSREQLYQYHGKTLLRRLKISIHSPVLDIQGALNNSASVPSLLGAW
jgi:hypothetical protein